MRAVANNKIWSCDQEELKGGGKRAEKRGGGSSVLEHLVRGGSFIFQPPIGSGSSSFTTRI